MCFGEPDHGFELSGRGGDAARLRGDGGAKSAHGDVGADEGVGGGLGDCGRDVGARVRDVGG